MNNPIKFLRNKLVDLEDDYKESLNMITKYDEHRKNIYEQIEEFKTAIKKLEENNND